MPFIKRRKALCFLRRGDGLQRSRREQRRKVMRASILLDSLTGLSDQAVAAKHKVNRNTVVRCILTQAELRPHKIRYYVEKRDPEFEAKMANVLHVYKAVEIINEGLLSGRLKEPS